MSERDLAAEIDALAKRIESLEGKAAEVAESIEPEKATDGTPPAPSENILDDLRKLLKSKPLTGKPLQRSGPFSIRDFDQMQADLKRGAKFVIGRLAIEDIIEAIERAAEPPQLDDAFPIPAPVEQGPTTSIWTVDSISHQLAEARQQLAAKDAEIDDLRSQLSAATAANVERDRDHEAMEWIASLPTDTEVILWRGVSGQCYCCVGKAPEGVEGTGPTPADAIAAAKSAEGNG